jgi:ankyrin repeat protein
VEQIAFEGNSCFSCVKMIYQKTRWLNQEGGGCDSGDTPVHHAARSRNLRMLFHFICLVGDEYGQEGAAAVLRKLNGRKETALHEAIKVGNNGMVGLLMWVDPELAQYPEAGQGTSPLYLAVSLRLVHIAQMLYRKSGHGTYLSYSGPDGQNALHVAVLPSSRDCGKIHFLL